MIQRDLSTADVSARLSVTRWQCVKTNKRRITRLPLSGSPSSIFSTNFHVLGSTWTPVARVLNKNGVSKIAKNTQSSDLFVVISPKRWEIRLRLLLTVSRKSHTGFRLVRILMSLNNLERPFHSMSRLMDEMSETHHAVCDRKIATCLEISVL